MPTVSGLLDSLDVQPDRRQLVAEALETLGYLLDEQAGEALGAITEAQLQSVRVNGARLNVREINALLVKCRPQGTREEGDLTFQLSQVIDALQDSMTLTRLVLRGQLRPVSSSASTKRLEEYRRAAIEHYYGSQAEMSKIRCMVTGDEVDIKQITAGHIYRRGWQTGLLKAMGCRLHDPCNIILMQKQLETHFDNWEWTIIPEGPDVFRVHVLNPRLLDPKGLGQYITGHAGRGRRWDDIDKTLLHLPPVARPARRICGLHAILAVQEADSKGWFDEEHEAPMVSEASWESPTFDHQLMNKFLSDTNTADMF